MAKQEMCDIVVLGGGGAGLVAAARISETTDKKVIVVEKRKTLGGGAAGAADWRVYGSRWQKERGIPDNTMSALRKVMDETYWQLDPKLAYNTFKATGEFFDFLCDTGEGVEDLYQIGTYIFDTPSGPKIPAFKQERKGGNFVMTRMKAICEKNGVELLTNTSLTDIEKTEGGYLVSAQGEDGVVTIAAKACILATGSWIRNREIVEKYVPKCAKMHMGDGGHTHPSYTGDGIKIAEKLGAYLDYESFNIRLMGPLGMCPSKTLMSMTAETYTVQVNKNGKRWINETTQKRRGIFETGNKLIEQPDFTSYYIFDQSIMDAAVTRFKSGAAYEWSFPSPPSYPDNYMADVEAAFGPAGMPGMPGGPEAPGGGPEGGGPGGPGGPGGGQGGMPMMPKSVFRAETIEELAGQMGVDKVNLKATIENYNRMCQNGVDEEFFKDADQLLPFTKGPYYAVTGSMGTDGAFGGVLVDDKIQAFSTDGGKVPGLYVPGDFSSGRFINVDNNKVQIINDLSWAFASGWIAAQSAVDYLKQ